MSLEWSVYDSCWQSFLTVVDVECFVGAPKPEPTTENAGMNQNEGSIFGACELPGRGQAIVQLFNELPECHGLFLHS